MTYGACTPSDFARTTHEYRASTPISPALLCALAIVTSTSFGLWALYALPDTSRPSNPTSVVTASSVPAPLNALTAPPVSVALPAAVPHLRREAALRDPAMIARRVQTAFAASAPLRSSLPPSPQPAAPVRIAILEAPKALPIVPVAPAAPSIPAMPLATEAPANPQAPVVPPLVSDVPLPQPRPAFLSRPSLPHTSQPRPVAPQAAAPEAPAPAAPASDQPSFFDRLFKRPQTAPGTALAYATPDDGGLLTTPGRPVAADGATAIYDIAAHTVYLPDGTRLEAHSGLGSRLDDPRSVSERMRGATPPNVYELALREAPFHGVQALRLNPVGSGTTYGRGGLLAHTYMLGPRGDSNGCVVFKNYQAFLAAYSSGQVKRLMVVSRLN